MVDAEQRIEGNSYWKACKVQYAPTKNAINGAGSNPAICTIWFITRIARSVATTNRCGKVMEAGNGEGG